MYEFRLFGSSFKVFYSSIWVFWCSFFGFYGRFWVFCNALRGFYCALGDFLFGIFFVKEFVRVWMNFEI